MSSSASSPHPKPLDAQNTKHVVLGNLLFKTWYQSIYPEDLVASDTDRLYVCRWCFRYSCDGAAYTKHTRACEHRTTPPGTKVYDDAGYSVWEIDGAEDKLFAQNLSLFSKLFVDHKSVFFDVVSFLFYILVFTDPNDPDNYSILGYFSKEKLSWDPNNLACILIFPPYQHKQLGKLLMGVSYKLSAWEKDAALIGGPERPLSEMGKKSYVRFWEERIARYLLLDKHDEDSGDGDGDSVKQQQKISKSSGKKRPHPQKSMSVQEIGLATGMLTDDVVTALTSMGVVEPTTSKKRKKAPSSEEDTTAEDRSVSVRKSKVMEWVKSRRVALHDPVREEGFLGGWALSNLNGVRSVESEEEEE